MDELSFPVLLGCLAIGMVLLALEVFVTPGVGIKGFLGLGLILFAVVFAFVHHGPVKGFGALVLATVILGLTGYVAKVTVGKRLVLGDQLGPTPLTTRDLASLRDQRGVAISPLRPAGVARFGDQRVDVTAEANFVESGTEVVVIAIHGNRVTVRPIS